VFYDDLRELENNKDFPEKELVIPYTLDCRKGSLCFEVNGPSHYIENENGVKSLDGINMLKKNFLEQMGFKYIEINNLDFTPEISKDDTLFAEKLMQIVKSQMSKWDKRLKL